MVEDNPEIYDILIVGGGVNGTAIARDAVGRGYKVCLMEQADLASATSSASTKLFHGGLRYLEYFEFRLVREALIEREILLRMMPHIAWPMRFILPILPKKQTSEKLWTKFQNMLWPKGQRASWMIRLGLFIYDHLGGRKILPSTTTLDLRNVAEGVPLKDDFILAFEYSDCWVQDARLVSLLARDAKERGARILTHHKVTGAQTINGYWQVEALDIARNVSKTFQTRLIVNAAGPWVGHLLERLYPLERMEAVRLVKGSHIVTKRLYDHQKCYFLQGNDGRIIFTIPYEEAFTLIGTTDLEHEHPDQKPICSDEERQYLLDLINHYFKRKLKPEDIIWDYAGVRPLFDDGSASASAATRDYVIKLERKDQAPILSIYGGKITTHRKLAEEALKSIDEVFARRTKNWTKTAKLPGAGFDFTDKLQILSDIKREYSFLDERIIERLFNAYGLDVREILKASTSLHDLGQYFGAGLYEAEVRWLMVHEFARTIDDIIWRRSKLGLHMTESEKSSLEAWLKAEPQRA